ncbi:MAG: hypothetical protein A2Y50_05070 [Pseudomonadales bacterium RIFCSPLOWO2_12_59_9]|nr:MAG: hypothetical protein A2Y50_05070 [Pseudomonadales bacterium RIFCSPLOWO2_12_59_9]
MILESTHIPLFIRQEFFSELARSCLCKHRCHTICINQHIFTIDPYGVFGQTTVRRIDAFTGAAIEYPLVRPTNYNLTVECAFYQRDILVWAYALEGTNFTALRTHQQNFMAIDFESRHFAFPEIIQIANLYKCHCFLPSVINETHILA